MKKMIVKALMVMAVIAGSNSAMALDAQVRSACQNAFEGKCFHGVALDVGLGEIESIDDTEGYCTSHPNHCAVSECKARLDVLYGFIPGPTTGNPCLPR